MLNTLFQGLFYTTAITVPQFMLCMASSLVIGLFLAFIYTRQSSYTSSFLITLTMLPAIVCVVIMLVNGNVGTGVAVAGTFSLVRFRSQPGSAREIGTLFLAMGAGLACGMGYLGFALFFTVLMGLLMLILERICTGLSHKMDTEKVLKITIPEDLDYCELFDDIFQKYTSRYENISVKTTNMGSLYKLTYNVTLKGTLLEKRFLDELRCRNGNLEISLSRQEVNHEL